MFWSSILLSNHCTYFGDEYMKFAVQKKQSLNVILGLVGME
ncbi:hypothetical protein HanIR_Chr05g0219501 [Helianthus annuus]|nr:hypothetical protein HanIR_Chr05g0219501 [Helianthus annuus]